MNEHEISLFFIRINVKFHVLLIFTNKRLPVSETFFKNINKIYHFFLNFARSGSSLYLTSLKSKVTFAIEDVPKICKFDRILDRLPSSFVHRFRSRENCRRTISRTPCAIGALSSREITKSLARLWKSVNGDTERENHSVKNVPVFEQVTPVIEPGRAVNAGLAFSTCMSTC